MIRQFYPYGGWNHVIRCFLAGSVCCALPCLTAHADALELARIRPGVDSHLENAGWGLDRCQDLHALRPQETQIIADCAGPGVIRQIHITQVRRWVDYSMVYYWYLDQPGGFEHAPLLPLEQRRREFIKGAP